MDMRPPHAKAQRETRERSGVACLPDPTFAVRQYRPDVDTSSIILKAKNSELF